MRPLPIAILVATLMAGCTDLGMPEPRLEVTGATVVDGDCTFGQRGNASDPEWCHVLDVRVDNGDGTAAMNVQGDKWRALSDPGGDEHLLPDVDGATDVPRGQNATLTLAFDAPPDVRLVRLRYVDGLTGASAEANVPTY